MSSGSPGLLRLLFTVDNAGMSRDELFEDISRRSLALQSFENRSAAAVIFNEDALSRCSRVSVEGYNTLLSEDCIRIELHNLFRSCGPVSCVEISRDPVTNLINRCAIVYLRGEGAKERVLSLNGCYVGGWYAVIKSLPKIKCRFDPDQVAQLRAAYDRKAYNRRVGICVEGYDTSLPVDVVKNALIKHFCRYGEIVAMSISDRQSTLSPAKIYYCERGAAEKALAHSGSYIGPWKIVVKAVPELSTDNSPDPYGRYYGSTVRRT